MSGVGSRVSVTLEGGRLLSEEGRNSVRVWSERVRDRVRVTARVNKGESLEFPSSSLLFSSLCFGGWQPVFTVITCD